MAITPRIKLIFLLLFFTGSSAIASDSIYDDLRGRQYCPDGILPARSTEQLVDNLMLLFQQSFDKDDYGLNEKNLKCFFKEDMQSITFYKYPKDDEERKDYKKIKVMTRVYGQLFMFLIYKSRTRDNKDTIAVELEGLDLKPEVALIETIKKYFPNLEARFNYKGAPFDMTRDQYDMIIDFQTHYALPHRDSARGEKIVKGKLHSGKYKFDYHKDLDDGKCYAIPGEPVRKNCRLKEEANLFTLYMRIIYD